MGRINYCPIIGGQCNKIETEIIIQKDTFFLAEPFQPKQDRIRRERAVKNALRETLKEEFSGKSLRVADKEPKEPAIFCEICRLIQSSAYGIVDISKLNPNVLIELGMMLCLGKPVFVLVKKGEQEDLKEKLPSDIVWKRVIAYDEFIDIEEELSQLIKKRPQVEPEPSLAEKTKELFAEVAPSLAKEIDAKLQEVKRDQAEALKSLVNLLKEAGLSKTIPKEKKIEISPSLEKGIDELDSKVERIEKLVGLPKDPEIAFLRGNWHYHRKEYDRALELYDWVLTLNPDFLSAWNNKGNCLGLLGRWEEAKNCYEEVLKINPNDIITIENLSEALLILENFARGLKIAKKALGLAKQVEKKVIAWFLCISAYFFKKESEKAQNEIKLFINYSKKLKKEFITTEWDFYPLLPAIDERLRGENKRKLLSLISLLKGEIDLDEFERRIKSS